MIQHVFLISLGLALAPSAAPSTVVACTGAHGTTFSANITTPTWNEDRAPVGTIALMHDLAHDAWDIVILDPPNEPQSATTEGATVRATTTDKGDIVVNVVYSDLKSHTYVFWLSQPDPIVSFTRTTLVSSLRAQGLFTAKCERLVELGRHG